MRKINERLKRLEAATEDREQPLLVVSAIDQPDTRIAAEVERIRRLWPSLARQPVVIVDR
jgi:hypothetical protein